MGSIKDIVSELEGIPVPKDRVQTLRTGFENMMRDNTFLADAEKLKLEIELVSASEMAKVVDELYATSPEVLAVVKAALED